MSFALFFLSKKKVIRMCDNVCSMFNKKVCKNVINMGGAYNYNEYTLRTNLENLSELDFEGYKFSVPANYKELLSNMYGDYMKLPPVEQRGKQHNMVKIDKGSYKIKNKAAAEVEQV